MSFLKKETIFQDITKLKGVGSVLSKYLKKKRIEKIKDIIFNLPYSETDRSKISKLNELEIGKIQSIKVLVKKLNSLAKLPSYKTDGASGMDLMACIEKPISLEPGKSCLIPTGLSVAFSEKYEIQIRPRSGLAAKNSISVLNTPGTIDSDYRGELKIILFNHSNENFIIKNNDRVAQMVLTPIVKMELEEINELPNSNRGYRGFGSTGK